MLILNLPTLILSILCPEKFVCCKCSNALQTVFIMKINSISPIQTASKKSVRSGYTFFKDLGQS